VRAKGWLFFDSISRNQSGDPLPSTDHSARDAFILYTSGSSAKPKAVRLSNKACIENGFNIGERMGLTPADRVLVAPPLFWSYGAANAWPAILSHGATMVLQSQFQPGEALDLIERHRCTALYTLPGMTNALVGHREFRRERTKTLRTGLTLGTPHDIRKAAEQLGAAEICNIYGLTETGGNCAVTWHHAPLDERADNQGPPLPGQTIRIVEAGTGNPLPAGQAGEVEVSGPYVTPGYAGASAALNDQAFTADGFLRTGDLGFLDEEARFHFIARNTEVIKRNGINVSPAEVEDAIQGVDGVASVAVAGAPSEQHGEIIVAFVIAKPSGVSTDAIRAACMDRLSRYKLPDHIELCDKLPMTETGKLARKTLKEWAARATKSA
jgi:fatty-acyl-CoA synthase